MFIETAILIYKKQKIAKILVINLSRNKIFDSDKSLMINYIIKRSE